jgi:hypothetical protein
MKFAFAAAVSTLLLAACGGAETPATTAETPAASETPAGPAATETAAAALTGPSAGKWRSTTTASGMTMPPMEICYDKQMSMEEAQAIQQSAGVECSVNTYSADASGMTGHSVCKMGDTTITSDTKVVGDFASAYTMEITSSMDPAPAGMPNPSVTSIKMERLGDCTP